jgi:hypothetical protein
VSEWVSSEVSEGLRGFGFKHLPVARNEEQLVRGSTHLIFPDGAVACGDNGTFTLTTVDLLVGGQWREACAAHRCHGTVVKVSRPFYEREAE